MANTGTKKNEKVVFSILKCSRVDFQNGLSKCILDLGSKFQFARNASIEMLRANNVEFLIKILWRIF